MPIRYDETSSFRLRCDDDMMSAEQAHFTYYTKYTSDDAELTRCTNIICALSNRTHTHTHTAMAWRPVVYLSIFYFYMNLNVPCIRCECATYDDAMLMMG